MNSTAPLPQTEAATTLDSALMPETVPCRDDIMALLVMLSIEPDHLSPAARAQYDSASARRTRSIARQAARDITAPWLNQIKV